MFMQREKESSLQTAGAGLQHLPQQRESQPAALNIYCSSSHMTTQITQRAPITLSASLTPESALSSLFFYLSFSLVSCFLHLAVFLFLITVLLVFSLSLHFLVCKANSKKTRHYDSSPTLLQLKACSQSVDCCLLLQAFQLK